MGAVVLLDTSAVIGFLDARDAHHSAARDSITSHAKACRLIASAITLSEVLAGLRAARSEEAGIRGFFNELLSEVVPVDAEVADRAATLRASKQSLRLPDALVLATGEVHADVTITADPRWAKLGGLVTRVETL